VLQFFQEHAIESSTWDLVRHRIVTDHAFKVGPQPGVVLFLEADSEDAAVCVGHRRTATAKIRWINPPHPVLGSVARIGLALTTCKA
jgi:hypothetical protein